MTSSIPFDPGRAHHPLRRMLPHDVIHYTVVDPPRARHDLRDFWVTFLMVFTGVLTLFG